MRVIDETAIGLVLEGLDPGDRVVEVRRERVDPASLRGQGTRQRGQCGVRRREVSFDRGDAAREGTQFGVDLGVEGVDLRVERI